MTVYQQISRNKFKTIFVFLWFFALIALISYVAGYYFEDPNTFLIFGLFIALISGFGSYFYSDKIVLGMTGAKPADKEKYFDYYTSVENLSIATGVLMPKVYVIEDEAPNAFATGRDPKHGVIVATTGLLDKLNRAETEGVISHELSHIKNYDILVMMVVTVLAGMIVFATDMMSRSMMYGGRRRSSNKGGSAMLFIFLAVIILTPIFATLIKLAISRKREYMADASGVLITRNPKGLASALEKISKDSHVLKRASNATSHLFITNPFQKKSKFTNFVAGLFSTHPPIDKRISLLENM